MRIKTKAQIGFEKEGRIAVRAFIGKAFHVERCYRGRRRAKYRGGYTYYTCCYILAQTYSAYITYGISLVKSTHGRNKQSSKLYQCIHMQ